MAQRIRVRLVRSTIGTLPKQRATVRSLGLRKIGSSVEHEDGGVVRGMVRVVSHLVVVEDVNE
ncbi:MAG: 50S ribosomal protein L30 [Treponema sp.]|jgi:large subunit ribosomal protein L30|nr:50S ribosomal protein L30 [Treponema sp.]